MAPGSQTRAPLAAFAAVLVALVAWRALVLATNGIDLHPDEAQYVVWSRDPAFGYYSKPPMVAWAIAAMSAVCGEGEACVRFAGTLLQAGAAALVAVAGAMLFGARVGFAAGLVYATLPMTSFSSLFVTTDAPLCFFSAAALVFAIRALRDDRLGDWLGLGASFGLGLMSKYSTGVMVLAWLVFLVVTPARRRLLLSPKHLAAAAVAAAVFLPNLLWNAAYDFPTLKHTAEISQVDRPKFGFGELGLFVASQLGVLGPLVAIGLAVTLASRWRKLADERFRLLAVLFLAPLALFSALAFVSRSNANWAAFALVPGSVLVAGLLLSEDRKRFLAWAIGVNVAIAIVFSHLPHLMRAAGVELKGRSNPLYRVTGWGELGSATRARLDAAPGHVLLTDERLVAAELLYYAKPAAFAVWNPERRLSDHFRVFHDASDRLGESFLFVTRNTPRDALADRFESIEDEPPIAVDMGGTGPVVFRVYRLGGFKGYTAP